MEGNPKPSTKLAMAASTNNKKILPAAILTISPERRTEMPVNEREAIIIPAMAQANPIWTTFLPVDSRAARILRKPTRVFFLHQLTATTLTDAQQAESSGEK